MLRRKKLLLSSLIVLGGFLGAFLFRRNQMTDQPTATDHPSNSVMPSMQAAQQSSSEFAQLKPQIEKHVEMPTSTNSTFQMPPVLQAENSSAVDEDASQLSEYAPKGPPTETFLPPEPRIASENTVQQSPPWWFSNNGSMKTQEESPKPAQTSKQVTSKQVPPPFFKTPNEERVALNTFSASAPMEVTTYRPEPIQSHVIRDGDTLYRIAERYLKDGNRYLEIYEANRKVLPAPDVLPIGVSIKLPSKHSVPIKQSQEQVVDSNQPMLSPNASLLQNDSKQVDPRQFAPEVNEPRESEPREKDLRPYEPRQGNLEQTEPYRQPFNLPQEATEGNKRHFAPLTPVSENGY